MFEKTILITGGAGFIGTNFIEYFAAKYPNYLLVDLDLMTYAGHKVAFELQTKMPNVVPVQGDIRNVELIRFLMKHYDISGVIHFAAESHVDNSIVDPLRFVSTNIDGTVVLLNEAKRYWMEAGRFDEARFHHISTDEVYGSLGATGFFSEETPYAPNSPYSASKASSDMLVRAYHHTYGMNVTISNCSNNYGPWQHAEKLIPTVIRKCLAHASIPVYGNGLNIRDWLWVGDHCHAIDAVFHLGRSGENYNIGGHNEKTNLDIIHQICSILDELQPWKKHHYAELISFVKDRPGHDFRYAIDPTKAERELGWKPQISFKEGIRKTIAWYL